MAFLKHNIIIPFICCVFSVLIFSCSGNEEQYKRDLDFVSKQYEKLIEIEKLEDINVKRKMEECYNSGIRSQFIISKYNRIKFVIDSGFQNYVRLKPFGEKNNDLEVDSIRLLIFKKVKDEISELVTQMHNCENYFIAPLKFMDSCSKAKQNVSFAVALSSKKLELLLLKKKLNTLFSNSCGKISVCNWGWRPFSGGLKIKNYSKKGISFLEIDYPESVNRRFLRNLKLIESEVKDTLSVSLLKIVGGEYGFKIDLSQLKAGEYNVDACIILIRPDNTQTPTYCEPIQFEVFK